MTDREFVNAKWIGGQGRLCLKETEKMTPATQFRKTFIVNEDFAQANCRICGLGLYVLYINGQRVGDDVLSPPFTDYNQRALYVEYDVAKYLRQGENVVSIVLGNGFYNQTVACHWLFAFAPWREAVKLIFELFVDGKEVCVSNKSWKCTQDGAGIHNCLRTGEYYDARKEDGWMECSYDDSAWEDCAVVHPIPLQKMQMPPIRETKSYQPIAKWKTANGWMFDFGVNMSGYCKFRLSGKSGQTLTIRYGEKLKDNELDNSNIEYCISDTFLFAADKYTFKGAEEEEWKPSFVYHGFRYVELIGLDYEPPMSALTAYFVHTDLVKKGDFSCSSELLNWIYKAGVQSFLSNWHGFSEDCPQREKNGWTGDGVISCDYAVALFEMVQSYKKWLQDIVDTQRKSGQLAAIAPTAGWGYNWGSGPAWDCAIFFIPYIVYQETGDVSCFDVVYDCMQDYLAYVKYWEEDGLVSFGLPDWCPPENIGVLRMSNALSDSCYYYAMLCIAADAARLKGDDALFDAYMVEANRTKQAILDTFVDGENVDNNTQGALAEVLYFRIVEGEQAKKIAAKLAQKMESDHYVFKVGILGMKALLNALSENGYTDVAYKIVNRYDYPSYGYWKNQGATTLWESWSDAKRHSRNHHMYADVVHWMFRHIAGLQKSGFAYESVAFKPYFFDENCSASATTQTPNGEVSISWNKQGNQFTADIVLPQGVLAVLQLPNQKPRKVGSGHIAVQLF